MTPTEIRKKITDFLKDHGSLLLTLENFIKTYHVPLEHIYRYNNTWTGLCMEAKDKQYTENDLALALSFAVYRKWLSTNSYSYFSFIRSLVDKQFKINYDELDPVEQKMTLMLYYDLFMSPNKYNNLQEMFDVINKDSAFINELKEVINILIERSKTDEKKDNSGIEYFPLKLHSTYTKEQIRVAIGTSTLTGQSTSREGIERNKELEIEAMYVDIIKNRDKDSPTNYKDHAINPNLFQWDTQNRVSPDSQTGQAYINGVNTMLLFVRQQANFPDDRNRTMGYVYLGKVQYKSHTYEDVVYGKQMRIKWTMLEPIPASVMDYAQCKDLI